MSKSKVCIPRKKIVDFSRREFSLFGSILRDDFRPDSEGGLCRVIY